MHLHVLLRSLQKNDYVMYWALGALRVNACGYVMVLVCWDSDVALRKNINILEIYVDISCDWRAKSKITHNATRWLASK